MKLCEVPRDTWITLYDGTRILFHHVDGMYSLCEDEQGNMLHVAAWTDVEIAKERGNVSSVCGA